MNPDSRAWDADPDSASNDDSRSSFFREEDPVVKDFNAFFEKLSALDDMTWDSSRTAEGEGEAQPGPEPDGDAMEEVALVSAGGQRKMRVLNSHAAFRRNADSGDDSSPGRPPAAQGPPPRATRSDLLWMIRILLGGMLLFAIGLGAGWTALSLPARFERSLPREAGGGPEAWQLSDGLRAIRNSLRGGQAQPEGRTEMAATNADGGDMAPATGKETTPATSGTAAQDASGKGRQNVKDAAGQAKNEAPATAKANPAVKLPKPRSLPPEVGASPGKVERIRLPVITDEDFGLTRERKATPPAPAPDSAVRRYSLQVAACGSERCVDSFRRLLEGKVATGSIRVIAQNGGSIQRIRIEPLTRAEAERLKAELIAGDARFEGAYLVSLR